MKKNNFTLTETIILVIIIGIIAAVVVPRMNMVNPFKLDGAARHMVANFNYVRSLAIQYNLNYQVDVDITSNSYSIKQNNVIIKNPLNTGNYKETFVDSAYNGVIIKSSNFAGNKDFVFQSNGSVDNNGSITLEIDGETITIKNESLTGKFYVQ